VRDRARACGHLDAGERERIAHQVSPVIDLAAEVTGEFGLLGDQLVNLIDRHDLCFH
jgi:hypothetical protein